MIYEILLCSSLPELDKYKSVSKEWKEMIDDPAFIKHYYERDDNVNGYLMEDMYHSKRCHEFVSMNESDKKRFTFSGFKGSDLPHPFDDIQIIASSLQGIICCLTHCGENKRFYVCKPTTGQWQKMPNPKLRYYFGSDAGIAVLGSKPLHFVIIRVSNKSSYRRSAPELLCSKFICELFDSKTWRWKQLEDLVLPFGIGLIGQAVHASGLMCWQTTNKNVVAFSTDGESRYVYPLPGAEVTKEDQEIGYFYSFHDEIIEYQGKVGLIRQACRKFMDVELWLLQGGRNNEEDRWWEKIMCIDRKSSSSLSSLESSILLQFYSSQVALVRVRDNAIFYRLQGDKIYDVAVNIKSAKPPRFFVFRSDFKPVDFKEPTTPNNHRSSKSSTALEFSYASWSFCFMILCFCLFCFVFYQQLGSLM